ncbi:hypothetical protein ABPG72_020049 [Tetrahymena utriculariae]
MSRKNKREQLEEDISISYSSTGAKWMSRRLISDFIVPSEHYFHEELALQANRQFNFRKSIAYRIPIEAFPVALCEAYLPQIWDDAGIQIFAPKQPKQTRKQREELILAAKLATAATLLEQQVQGKLILARTGLSKGQLAALRRRIALGGSIQLFSAGKDNLKQKDDQDYLYGRVQDNQHEQ